MFQTPPIPYITLGEFAKTVTPETLPVFLERLANESRVEEYQVSILEEAAKKLGGSVSDLLRDFRECQRSCNKKLYPINARDLLNTEPPLPDQIILDAFDKGDKVAIIGGSKQKKSLFFLQLLLCLATARNFLGLSVPKVRKVLMVQFEIQPNHYHRRTKMVGAALGISDAELGDNLHIINARGLGLTASDVGGNICQVALDMGIEVVAFDPLYKLMEWGENGPADFRPILSAFDRLAEQTGAAVLYVHHDPKGESGDRNLQDRGSGSNILSRDYDAALALSGHASGEDDTAVIELLLRNYPPRDGIAIQWKEGRFIARPDLPATKRTSGNKKNANKPPLTDFIPQALELVKAKPLPISNFRDFLKKSCALTLERTNAVVDLMIDRKMLEKLNERGRGKNICWIGLPEAIRDLKHSGI